MKKNIETIPQMCTNGFELVGRMLVQGNKRFFDFPWFLMILLIFLGIWIFALLPKYLKNNSRKHLRTLYMTIEMFSDIFVKKWKKQWFSGNFWRTQLSHFLKTFFFYSLQQYNYKNNDIKKKNISMWQLIVSKCLKTSGEWARGWGG